NNSNNKNSVITNKKSISTSPNEKTSEIKNKNSIDKILKLYLDCLKPEHCDKRESWLRIGAVIFNEHGSFELFDKWSKLSQKYESDACKELWNSFNINHKNKLTIGTLKKYAKEDDPVQYREIQQKTKFKKPIDADIKKSTSILDEIYNGGYIN